MKTKKSQSETVGFVIIILIVMILGVIFLGLSLSNKNKPIVTVDAELSNFLVASVDYTTECYKDYESDYKKLGEIVKFCYDGTPVTCPNGMDKCVYMNETYKKMAERFRSAGQVSYWSMSFVYNNSATEREFGSLAEGNLSGCMNKRGNEYVLSAKDGVIRIDMEICLSS